MADKKRKRIFMWFFLAVQALFLIWLITGLVKTGNQHAVGSAAVAGKDIGTTIGVGLVIGLWVAVDVILGVSRLIVLTARKRGNN
jgi:hypothetical protein